MFDLFNPEDWYWLADDDRLYSSKQNNLVDESDQDFIAWKAAGHEPTPWPVDGDGNQTFESLAEVLTPHQRQQVRDLIAKKVGDAESILGTVSDATGVLIVVALSDIVALSSSGSFDEYKKTRLAILSELSGDAEITTLATKALSDLKAGKVVITASIKGLDSVLFESLNRSTQVTTILSNTDK